MRLGSGSPEADARGFFERYSEQLGTSGHDLRLQVNEAEPGGGTYVRFKHFVPGTNYDSLRDVCDRLHERVDGKDPCEVHTASEIANRAAATPLGTRTRWSLPSAPKHRVAPGLPPLEPLACRRVLRFAGRA